MSLSEHVGEVAEGLETFVGQITRYTEWLECQHELECRRVSELKRALSEERARSFPFTDEQVLDALRGVYAGEPLSATTIAATLYGREATHSAVVRVGLTLSRVREAGSVEAAVPPTRRTQTRWAPITERDDG